MTGEARALLSRALRASGALAAWRRLHRDDVAILMLHGTADPARPSRWTPLRPQFSPAHIDWCLGVVGRHYRFVSLEGAVDALKGRTPPIRNGVAVTLDDGYRSNIADALPVFRKHGVPVTIFLPVTPIEKRVPLWFDRADYAIQSATPADVSFALADGEFRFSGGGREPLAASYAGFRRRMKGAYADEARFHAKIDEVVSELERRAGTRLSDFFEEDPWSALLDWEEIRAHQGEHVGFGSHTMDHYRVPGLAGEELRRQLSGSKRAIEEKTGRPCRFFAYPNGDWSGEARAAAVEAGYEAGVTTEEGINRTGCDCMTLRRISLPGTPDECELLARVGGLWEALTRRLGPAGREAA